VGYRAGLDVLEKRPPDYPAYSVGTILTMQGRSLGSLNNLCLVRESSFNGVHPILLSHF
jgi:hypothetical protein